MTRHTEARLLEAMRTASLSEQRKLTAELNDIRRAKTAARQEDRSIDVQSTVKDRLTPVFVRGLSSSETDWLAEAAPNYTTASIKSIASKLKAEASRWFSSVGVAVRQDKQEFTEQARGFSGRTASQYGTQVASVENILFRHIAALYKIAEGTDIAGIPSAADGETNPEVTDWAADPEVLPEADADAYTAPEGIEAAPEAPSPEGAGLDTESRRHLAGPEDYQNGPQGSGYDPDGDYRDPDKRGPETPSLHDPLQFGLFPGEAEVGKESAYRYLGSPIQQAARQYLGTEEGQTPPVPGEVDEDQDGEAKSTLPYDIGIPEETFDNFVSPTKPKDADSNRAPNVQGAHHTAATPPCGNADKHGPHSYGNSRICNGTVDESKTNWTPEHGWRDGKEGSRRTAGALDDYEWEPDLGERECSGCHCWLSGGDPELDEDGLCPECADPYSDSKREGYTPLAIDDTTVLESRHVDASRKIATSCPNCASSEVTSAGPSGRKMCNQCQTSFIPNAGGGTSDAHIREFAQKEGVATGPNPQGSFVYDAQRAIDQGYKEGFKYAILWAPGKPVPAALTSSAQLGDKYNSQYVTGYKSGVQAGIATLPQSFQASFGQAAGRAVAIASKRALVDGDQGQYRECPDCGGKGANGFVKCETCGGGGGVPAATASRRQAGLPQLELSAMDSTVSNPLIFGNTDTPTLDGRGASDVANVPTPGKSVADYPAPAKAEPEPAIGEDTVDDWVTSDESVDPAKTAAFRAKVRSNL